ncbi:MAG: hypothetical protein IT317_09660, partial [Anaerolineales bacterium]|nr:hypothetical protein [Anaerolineales bacterium]
LGEALQARGLTVRNVFPPGEPRAELVRLAHDAEAELVIVAEGAAPENSGGAQDQLAIAVAKYAPCSVLVLKTRPEPASMALTPLACAQAPVAVH